MKKRLLSILLCICMVITLLPTFAAAADAQNVYISNEKLEAGKYYPVDSSTKTLSSPVNNAPSSDVGYAYLSGATLTLHNFNNTEKDYSGQ